MPIQLALPGLGQPNTYQSERPDQFAGARPCGLNTRLVDAGYLANFDNGRRGRTTNSPPQLGQTPASTPFTQAAQKVHSNEQMRAELDPGGKSALQHSQLGRSCNMVNLGYGKKQSLTRSVCRPPRHRSRPAAFSRPGSRRRPTVPSDNPASAAGMPQSGCAGHCCRCITAGCRARGAIC